jgi:hypothetical protein
MIFIVYTDIQESTIRPQMIFIVYTDIHESTKVLR